LAEASSQDINLEQDLSQIDANIYAIDDGSLFILGQSRVIRVKDGQISSTSLPLQSELVKVGGWGLFSSNIYLADTADKQIYKYSLSSPARIAWLKDQIDISDIIGMYIDSDIYLLHADGRIDDLRIGRKQDITFDALDSQPSSASFLLGAGGNIAMCDPKNKSLAIWGKDGKLDKQYVFEGISQIVAMGASKDGRTAYVFDGIDIYSVGLE
jgi:hypothetical protein